MPSVGCVRQLRPSAAGLECHTARARRAGGLEEDGASLEQPSSDGRDVERARRSGCRTCDHADSLVERERHARNVDVHRGRLLDGHGRGSELGVREPDAAPSTRTGDLELSRSVRKEDLGS